MHWFSNKQHIFGWLGWLEIFGLINVKVTHWSAVTWCTCEVLISASFCFHSQLAVSKHSVLLIVDHTSVVTCHYLFGSYTVTHFVYPRGMTRLSWPGCLIKYEEGANMIQACECYSSQYYLGLTLIQTNCQFSLTKCQNFDNSVKHTKNHWAVKYNSNQKISWEGSGKVCRIPWNGKAEVNEGSDGDDFICIGIHTVVKLSI